jgi:N-acetylmuramate 1-kinase
MALAHDLAALLEAGDVLALDGDLGMGKSAFARALLRGRANDPLLEVPSPTFTLVQGYDFNDVQISHFDLYRISDFEELYEIGLDDSWQEGVALIEWPDRAETLLPASTLWLHLSASAQPDARHMRLEGPESWGVRLSHLIDKHAFLMEHGWGHGICRPIAGDLSPRSYDRVVPRPGFDPLEYEEHERDAQSAILMDSPTRAPGPLLPDGRLYDRIAHRVTSLAPMISIAQGLAGLGLRVPALYGHDQDKGLLLWEDFGNQTLSDSSGGTDRPVAERYRATVEALAALHQKPISPHFDGDGGQHALATYDGDAFRVELDVFLDHYWPHVKGCAASVAERDRFHTLWDGPLAQLAEAEQSLVLRDVQSPNCFWLEAEGRVGFIDFQDCLIGPAAYDMAALCLDARVSISTALEADLLAVYGAARGFDDAQQATFGQAYALCAVQRTSKNLGAFARAARQMGRVDYLEHMPRGLDYLARALSHPALEALRDFYDRHGLLDPSETAGADG